MVRTVRGAVPVADRPAALVREHGGALRQATEPNVQRIV